MRPFIAPLAPRIPTTQFFSYLCTVFCVLFVCKKIVFGFYECNNLFYIYLTFEARYCADGKFAQTSVCFNKNRLLALDFSYSEICRRTLMFQTISQLKLKIWCIKPSVCIVINSDKKIIAIVIFWYNLFLLGNPVLSVN